MSNSSTYVLVHPKHNCVYRFDLLKRNVRITQLKQFGKEPAKVINQRVTGKTKARRAWTALIRYKGLRPVVAD